MKKRKTFIIAEAGVNHNGNVGTAKKLIDIAAAAGADAVKFQTFTAEKIVSRHAPKAEYQKKITGKKESQFEMLKRLELSRKDHQALLVHCRQRRVVFLSTAFDIDSVDFLNKLGLSIFKIPSGEITNLPYLRKIGGLKKKVLLSTGMADLREVENALNILIESGTKKERITVLHCTTAYPTPLRDVNLRAMITMRDAFQVNVGYSDHTLGIEIPVAAVAMGATVIEKHFTLGRNMPGPDHSASLETDELRQMIRSIRNVEKALGNQMKKATPSEKKNLAVARRSIIAARDIRKGEVFTEKNTTAKRPGTGLSPMRWDEVLGRKAARKFFTDELIEI